MCLAVPAKVLALLPDAMARVDAGGVIKDVSVALVEDLAPGDYVILHVGYALSRLDPEEADRTLALIAEMVTAGAAETPVVS
ncbi:HypC/HybG/HupF family hydrogenase formation chaperone [Roseospira visakhapatnamensis]|uniref:Hydrogenase maturation factor HypC n=1 Tax=Roseospira visakhapatnamensis TaxID=390880 RepID=A0A7W6WB29_9PROT|nr:HypC/HybG/HupF family hydrogenase formation chaperone [Roseospira visakhapatnamensis]MBB4267107.1 hydrogenase expression/formation protein HypC [Roseospira visakhapatnamensis]